MAAEKELETLKKELQEAKQREQDMQEHLEDLKAQKELQEKGVLQKRTVVKVDKKDYEIIGNARIGGQNGKTYTKEELAKSENKELVKQMIEKGSGLIRPL